MTNPFDLDRNASKTPVLPFPASQLDRSGLRMTRAELARLLGVTKQTVSNWVKGGKITLGADGRIDPRHAVSQLLRTTDPARLRSRVLSPLLNEVTALRDQIAQLSAARDLAKSDAEFYEGACYELLDRLKALDAQLLAERERLAALTGDQVVDAVRAWLSIAGSGSGDPVSVVRCLTPEASTDDDTRGPPLPAPRDESEGGGESATEER